MTNHRQQNGDTPRSPHYEYEAETNVRRAGVLTEGQNRLPGKGSAARHRQAAATARKRATRPRATPRIEQGER